ncbi:hypothetical protein DPMN_061866 [Dreissena polymorpha]|uniref:Uncharacterized protein n=1 Tax=Dreissena polymorpha TaxID=45954 RepID=A0A9D4C8N3_DREPO|nr:hypothetical protein DPMN_061866 [Dreissena polymorpha]
MAQFRKFNTDNSKPTDRSFERASTTAQRLFIVKGSKVKKLKIEKDICMWALENGKHKYCQEQLTEIEGKMHKRNKCISIADSSSGGWETVRQYESNPKANRKQGFKTKALLIARKMTSSQRPEVLSMRNLIIWSMIQPLFRLKRAAFSGPPPQPHLGHASHAESSPTSDVIVNTSTVFSHYRP